MSRMFCIAVSCLAVIAAVSTPAIAANSEDAANESILISGRFPALAEKQDVETTTYGSELTPAVWPFSSGDKDNATPKPKSTRKAFFLSMLMPGLGQFYVGSKTGFGYLAVEGAAWWLYLTKTSEGDDKEDEFRAFADANWNYTDTDGDLGHSYFDWLKAKGYISEDTTPTDYDKIRQELEQNADISVHHYTGRKDQQDYEMIGKYPQFVYGWNDIVANNQALRNEDGTFNGNYEENLNNIVSPNRLKYEDMRDESNDLLKMGQNGLYVMILNRVISAIHAGRLAYKHNQRLESDISSIDIKVVQKRVLDNYVPMLRVTKRY